MSLDYKAVTNPWFPTATTSDTFNSSDMLFTKDKYALLHTSSVIQSSHGDIEAHHSVVTRAETHNIFRGKLGKNAMWQYATFWR